MDTKTITKWQIPEGEVLKVSWNNLLLWTKPSSGIIKTIKFNSVGSDSGTNFNPTSLWNYIIEGRTYLEMFQNFHLDKLYPGIHGIKFGSSKKSGRLVLTLKEISNITKIEVFVAPYKTDNTRFSIDEQEIALDINQPDGYWATINIQETTNQIIIKTIGKRAYLKDIKITCKEA